MSSNASEWWLWKINRQVAQFIHEPSEEREKMLVRLIAEYHAQYNSQQIDDDDQEIALETC